MNIPKLAVAAALLALVASLAGCTDDKPTGTPTSSAAELTTTAAPSGPPAADLTKLTAQQLTGSTPTTLPEWKPGGDPVKYSVDTLRLLVAAANKAGVPVSPVNYAIYTGNSKLVVNCTGNTSTERPAKETGAALYCEEVSGILLVPNNWSQTDAWDADIDKVGVHPLHRIIEALAIAIDPAGVASSKESCTEGKLYGGITLTQPNLGRRVAAYLAPAGKMEYHPTETWRNKAYAEVVAGTAQPC